MTIAERLEQKGRQEGRMEGRMEGALEKALAIACQLQKMGMTPEQIKQATGLSDDELEENHSLMRTNKARQNAGLFCQQEQSKQHDDCRTSYTERFRRGF